MGNGRKKGHVWIIFQYPCESIPRKQLKNTVKTNDKTMSNNLAAMDPRDETSEKGPLIQNSTHFDMSNCSMFCQWEFQDPKMEVLFPYIGLIYGRYLQFRFLTWPWILCEIPIRS